MKMLAVPVPLFNKVMGVEAYCFRFQKGDSLLSLSCSTLDGATSSPLIDIINSAGLEAITTGKPIFVPVSHIFLLMDINEMCAEPPHKIIFTLANDMPVDETFTGRMRHFKEKGYRFACHSKMHLVKQLPIIELCDFIFLDVLADFDNSYAYVKTRIPNITIIVSDIETAAMFSTVKNAGFTLFEGSFYRLPVTKGQTNVSPLKINYVRLLNIVRDADFEIDQISAVVQQDTALAISLLRLVNSLGLGQIINSISHAAVMLGQLELRKWITTAVTKVLSADKPNEITRLTLIRAKFAENIAKSFEMAMQESELFLMGLFSSIDVILDMSMQEALELISVSDKIRDAILNKKGPFYKVLSMILNYESADWIAVSRDLIIYKIDVSDVSNAYFDALLWYGELVKQSENVNLDTINNGF